MTAEAPSGVFYLLPYWYDFEMSDKEHCGLIRTARVLALSS